MLFDPANIANALRNRGLPIAREQLAKRQSGVRVFSAGGAIFFEYKIYPDVGGDDRTEETISSLSAMGYGVSQINDTGVYQISERDSGARALDKAS